MCWYLQEVGQETGVIRRRGRWWGWWGQRLLQTVSLGAQSPRHHVGIWLLGGQGQVSLGPVSGHPRAWAGGSTYHSKRQLLVQWISGQVVQGHRWGQGWTWSRGGVGEAPQGVLLPKQVHIVVKPLQGLEEAGVDQPESVTESPPTPLASGPLLRLTIRGCWVCSDTNCPRGAMWAGWGCGAGGGGCRI